MRLIAIADTIDDQLKAAMRLGAIPVVPKTPETEAFLGTNWPYYAGNETLAIQYGWGLISNTTVHNIRKRLQ